MRPVSSRSNDVRTSVGSRSATAGVKTNRLTLSSAACVPGVLAGLPTAACTGDCAALSAAAGAAAGLAGGRGHTGAAGAAGAHGGQTAAVGVAGAGGAARSAQPASAPSTSEVERSFII